MAQTAELIPMYGNVISVDFSRNISTAKPQKNYDVARYEARNGSVEPIRSDEDLKRILNYFYENKEYRNWCIFYVGINCGLRASDLLRLKISDVASPVYGGGYKVKERVHFRLKPKKTAKTGKYVDVYLYENTCKVIQKYLDLTGGNGGMYEKLFADKGYLFPSGKSSSVGSKRNQSQSKTAGDPIDVDSYGKILKNEIQRGLGLPYNIGTHSMRKTFGYRFFRQNQESGMALAYLQDIFNHSDQGITRRYIGLSQEEKEHLQMNYDCGVSADMFCN